jgi:hypothetical protein
MCSSLNYFPNQYAFVGFYIVIDNLRAALRLSKRVNRSVHLDCLELFTACGDENLRNAKRINASLALRHKSFSLRLQFPAPLVFDRGLVPLKHHLIEFYCLFG